MCCACDSPLDRQWKNWDTVSTYLSGQWTVTVTVTVMLPLHSRSWTSWNTDCSSQWKQWLDGHCSLTTSYWWVNDWHYYYYYRVLRAVCCHPVDGSLICNGVDRTVPEMRQRWLTVMNRYDDSEHNWAISAFLCMNTGCIKYPSLFDIVIFDDTALKAKDSALNIYCLKVMLATVLCMSHCKYLYQSCTELIVMTLGT